MIRLALDPCITEPKSSLDYDLDSTKHVIDFLSAEWPLFFGASHAISYHFNITCFDCNLPDPINISRKVIQIKFSYLMLILSASIMSESFWIRSRLLLKTAWISRCNKHFSCCVQHSSTSHSIESIWLKSDLCNAPKFWCSYIRICRTGSKIWFYSDSPLSMLTNLPFWPPIFTDSWPYCRPPKSFFREIISVFFSILTNKPWLLSGYRQIVTRYFSYVSI